MNYPATTITLYRHGQTEWSAVGRFAGSTDLPLTEVGAAAVSEYRERHGTDDYDERLVSPLRRAVQTAELLGHPDAIRDPRLRERDYGEYEGMTTVQIRERHPGWNVWTDPIPGGEPADAFAARVDLVVEQLRSRSQGRVLIVAHAHWIRMFTARWLGLAPESARLFRADPLRQTVLGWEREHPVMLAWNR